MGLAKVGSDLTAFERRILLLRASGLVRGEIAAQLHRSPQTISNALTVAKEKLGANSILEAVIAIGAVAGTQELLTK